MVTSSEIQLVDKVRDILRTRCGFTCKPDVQPQEWLLTKMYQHFWPTLLKRSYLHLFRLLQWNISEVTLTWHCIIYIHLYSAQYFLYYRTQSASWPIPTVHVQPRLSSDWHSPNGKTESKGSPFISIPGFLLWDTGGRNQWQRTTIENLEVQPLCNSWNIYTWTVFAPMALQQLKSIRVTLIMNQAWHS